MSSSSPAPEFPHSFHPAEACFFRTTLLLSNLCAECAVAPLVVGLAPLLTENI